jgi:hypothetical protein
MPTPNALKLAADVERWRRWARQLRREIHARLDYGDTNHVATALEVLAHDTAFGEPGRLMDFLDRCDGAAACDFLLHGCATDAGSRALVVVSGKQRLEWLGILKNSASWDICPLRLLPPALHITHT